MRAQLFKLREGSAEWDIMGDFAPFTLLGVLLIVVGIVLVALPLIVEHIPNVEDIPWIILWVYRSDGFVFATSPILIIISIISLVIHLVTRTRIG
ncbi:MAG: hypothetical protein WCC63_06225 [Candidatus Bathyarchaeia archaeon]